MIYIIIFERLLMKTRQQQIVRTGYIGIATNVLVSASKALVGVASGSMAIILDAVNNTADALSSLITIIGVKLAGRPADDEHPFGYGRIEYFTAVIIAAMILVAGGMSLKESVMGVIHPEEQEYTLTGIIIIVVSIFVKYALGIYTKRTGLDLNSDSLVASGTECVMDCLVSIATLVSAAASVWMGWALDSWLAAAISCLIIKAGVEMLMSPIKELLGQRSDPQLIYGIKQLVSKVEGARGVYDVVLHDYGPDQKIGALHVEVDDTLTAADLHHLTRLIQQVVRQQYGIFVTVGFYAHHQEGTDAACEEAKVREYVMAQDGVKGMHGFYVSHADRMLSFDIVYSFKLKCPISLRQSVAEWLQQDYAGYDINIGLDRVY